MSGIQQLKHNQPINPLYINANPQMRGHQNIGISLISPQNQVRNVQHIQVVQYPNQNQRQFQHHKSPQVQYISPQVGIPIQQHQLKQNFVKPSQAIPQNYQQQFIQNQPQQRIQQTQLPQHLQQQQYQQHQQQQQQQQMKQVQQPSRKTSSFSDFQPILPQQLLDYSGISNVQSGQQSPWFQSAKPDNSFILPLDKLQTAVTGTNTEVTGRAGIQEIRPFDLNNYQNVVYPSSNVQLPHPQIESYQICHTFQQPEQNTNNSGQYNLQNNQINNQDVMNVSFSQDRGIPKDSEINHSSNQKSFPNSHQTSFVIQTSILQSAPQVASPGYSIYQTPSSARNSPAVKINHLVPTLSFKHTFNDQINPYPTHQRSRSALSPPKSYRETIKSNEQLFASPSTSRAPNSSKYLEQYYNRITTPRDLSDRKENLNILPSESGQTPIRGSVGLQYISKNNPAPHFNDHPSQFHKSPERSKDAVSCVFFNYNEKKKPTKIKIKYTPIEQILSQGQLQEYQEKHKDLNLIVNKNNDNSHNNSLLQTSPLKEKNRTENILQNLENYGNQKLSFAQNDLFINDNIYSSPNNKSNQFYNNQEYQDEQYQ